jgi:transcriptional regulator with GAF, ATPase, and Fis domain
VRELENCLRAATAFVDVDTIQAADLVDACDDLRTATAVTVTLRPPVVAPSAAAADDENPPATPPRADGEAVTAAAYAHVRQGAASLHDVKRQIERACIARALAESGGVIARAAVLLGMKRPRLSQLVKQYGLSSSAEDGQ